MRLLSVVITLCLLCLPVMASEIPDPVVIDQSVMIQAGDQYGTGVLYKNGGDAFVWTVAHILSESQIQTNQGLRYKDVWVVQSVYQEGRKVGENKRIAKIVRYSQSDDIAVLHLYQKDWEAQSAKFVKPKYVPGLGDKIIHVGSFKGPNAERSFSSGEVAAVGRLRRDGETKELELPLVFDQASVVAHHGSSGGGVFDAISEECIGLISEFVMDESAGAMCFIPTRRLRDFADHYDCNWAINNETHVPVPAVMEVITVEPLVVLRPPVVIKRIDLNNIINLLPPPVPTEEEKKD